MHFHFQNCVLDSRPRKDASCKLYYDMLSRLNQAILRPNLYAK